MIDLLQFAGWQYRYGRTIHRNNREVLLTNDLEEYLQSRNSDLTTDDIEEIINRLRHAGGQTHFDILRNTFQLERDGYRYTRHGDNETFDIEFIDFENPKKNIFRCANQFEVGYGPKTDIRIPDVLLFVNGIPLCIIELKNPKDENATIIIF